MDRENGILIAGAGPVGLAAALFLSRQGREVRIVEQLSQPAGESRALAVNPRTLEILEPTGITAQMLELGVPVRGVSLHRKGGESQQIDFEGIHTMSPEHIAWFRAGSALNIIRARSAH